MAASRKPILLPQEPLSFSKIIPFFPIKLSHIYHAYSSYNILYFSGQVKTSYVQNDKKCFSNKDKNFTIKDKVKPCCNSKP